MGLPRSVSAIARYFDEEFGWGLIACVSQAPSDHVIELADQLSRHRWSPNRDSDVRRIAYDDFVVPTNLVLPLAERTGLKELLLYNEIVLAADPILDWAHRVVLHEELFDYDSYDQRSDRDELVQICRGLVPLRDLLETPAIEFVPSQTTIERIAEFKTAEQHHDYRVFDQITLREPSDNAFSDDEPSLGPLQAWSLEPDEWLSVREMAVLCDPVIFPHFLTLYPARLGDLRAYGLDATASGHRDEIVEWLTEDAPPSELRNLVPRVLQRAGLAGAEFDIERSVLLIEYLTATRMAGVVPMTGTEGAWKHLLRREGLSGNVQRPGSLEFRLPSPSAYTLDDVARLRRDEVVIADVRTALQAFLREVEARSVETERESLIVEATRVAEDVLQPSVEALLRASRIGHLTKLAERGGNLATRLAFDAITGGSAGVIGRKVAGEAGSHAAKRVARSLTVRSEAAATGARLLGLMTTRGPPGSV